MGVLASIVVSVLVGSFGVWLAWITKNKERKKADEKILHTAPDDPVGRAVFYERERMQIENSKPRPE